MRIEGSRLYIRPFERGDAESLATLINQSLPELTATMPWIRGKVTAKDELLFIEAAMQRTSMNESLTCGIFLIGDTRQPKNNLLIGTIGTHQIDWMNQKTSVGYWMGTLHARKGYMTEACVVMLDYLFTEYQLHRVGIQAAEDNAPSNRVIEKLGFAYEGTQREGELVMGKWLTLKSYAMLAQEYRARRTEFSEKFVGGKRPRVRL